MGFKQGSASNRPSLGGIVRFDHLDFRCTDNPGWRGRNACAFFGRSTPGYLLSGLQPEELTQRGLFSLSPSAGSSRQPPRCARAGEFRAVEQLKNSEREKIRLGDGFPTPLARSRLICTALFAKPLGRATRSRDMPRPEGLRIRALTGEVCGL
jgi:hypothetical protein